MGRSKVTARRGFGRGGPRFAWSDRSIAIPSGSSSNITTPSNGRDSSSSSETDSILTSLPLRELPTELITFVLQPETTSEPPRKRTKLSSGAAAQDLSRAEDVVYDHVIVRKTVWDIDFAGSKLSPDQTTKERSFRPYVHWKSPYSRDPDYLAILDDTRRSLFHTPIPHSDTLDDVRLALLVDDDSKKWAKAEGRLWTEFELELLQKDGHDVLRMTFTVKWNVTTSPYHAMQAKNQTQAMLKVMNMHFPVSDEVRMHQWSPQDFYQAVHSPFKNDETAVTITVEQLETDLYPFQKRAVQWMLRKEGVEWSGGGIRPILPDTEAPTPMSFVKTTDELGRQCYVSHLFGLVTRDPTPFLQSERQLKGGILAEEMGLGKTVEMIALIALHKRSQESTPQVFDTFTGQNVRPTGATLIIAPPSILPQWISEVNRHAPHLKITHYEGIKAKNKKNFDDLVEDLASSDIVITTYSVLAAEIHFTQLNPEKSLRRESKYPRPKSPLMLLSWWRCVIDEAQMIESGVSNAAVVARMIPRINAWCVTGTPVRKDVNDLLGLLVFLRYEPYATIKHVWTSLITTHKDDFRKLFGTIALRHSKQSVRDELRLPTQRRYVLTMPFTPIEEQHYQELVTEMCNEIGVDSQGAPLVDDWDPDNVSEAMRRWLVRLRQTALHPEVGGKNRKALGHKDGPLRTVDEVLSTMMENTDIAIRTDQRTLLIKKLKRGQLFENSPRVKEALAIWIEAAKEAAVIVEECRTHLQQELTAVAKVDAASSKSGAYELDSDAEDEDEVDPSSRTSVFRNRLRGALEVEHIAIFFRSNAYFQIVSNEEMTEPDTDDFRALEKLQLDGYEEAKKKRQEILQEIYRKSDRLMRKVTKRAASQNFIQIPEFPSDRPKGGIQSRRLLETLDELATALDAQANVLDDWREKTVQFLLRPLVDEDEGVETTGDEYEESTKTQEEVMVYVQALKAVIVDRHDALTGQNNLLTELEVKTSLGFARKGEGIFPEKTIELLEARAQVKPTKEMGSIRGVVSELRGLATTLRYDAENGSFAAQRELSIVDKLLQVTQKQLAQQMAGTKALEREVELFTSVMNARLEYYRQLQHVSDMVAPYEGPKDEATVTKMLQDEERLVRKIATAKAKRRYLDHLRMEASNPDEQRMCVICRETFEIGALTVCGHQYCKDCIRMWWNAHHNCPVCKRKLIQADMHQITYKPQELSIQAEDQATSQEQSTSTTSNKQTAIYDEISKSKLAEIKNIELDGPSFTTKVDTLARHLVWLRESDPGAKSIIFSQFKDFLDVLAQAFTKFRIGFSSIDKPNGIEKFKSDPGIECFLLHARAHSSGLNLVNANHVFLCEPLLNTALELQAIARVDRIGQHQETNVWLYLVDGTVEESIHQLSVKRRMEHIGQRLSGSNSNSTSSEKGKEKATTTDLLLEDNLEEANSMELQQASLTGLLAKGGKGGEMIAKEDLWECLFGGKKVRGGGSGGGARERPIGNSALRLDGDVARHLRAEAAEERTGAVGVGVGGEGRSGS